MSEVDIDRAISWATHQNEVHADALCREVHRLTDRVRELEGRSTLQLGPIPHGAQVAMPIMIQQPGGGAAHQHHFVVVIPPTGSDAPFELTIVPYVHHNPPPPPPETDEERRRRLVAEALEEAQGYASEGQSDIAKIVLKALAGEFIEDCELPHEIEGV